MRAFGKDRARETQAPARSISAAVPTPLGPPVGCHPTPSDGIAHVVTEILQTRARSEEMDQITSGAKEVSLIAAKKSPASCGDCDVPEPVRVALASICVNASELSLEKRRALVSALGGRRSSQDRRRQGQGEGERPT